MAVGLHVCNQEVAHSSFWFGTLHPTSGNFCLIAICMMQTKRKVIAMEKGNTAYLFLFHPTGPFLAPK